MDKNARHWEIHEGKYMKNIQNIDIGILYDESSNVQTTKINILQEYD